MKTQTEWENEVRAVYRKMSDNKYFKDIDGIRVHIFPNVFSPALFTDSIWFAKAVRKIVGKGSLLDIGTGTGIVGLFAALNGAEVTVTDINPDAVKNAKYNFKRHNVPVEAYCGDVFDPLPANQKFDFIFWNHPFNRGDNPSESMLLRSGFDYHYQGLEKYISNGHLYLKPKGRLLLGTGNFANLKEIEIVASKYGYKMKLLEKVKMKLAVESFLDNEYRIYELLEFG